ncbi:hypothetical protein RvVAT039_pl01480 (plasmid) [Agrobacterium vitis]|nr:hypothetical protein RvVAT039_pl01480 [Agrobacterium vitis]
MCVWFGGTVVLNWQGSLDTLPEILADGSRSHTRIERQETISTGSNGSLEFRITFHGILDFFRLRWLEQSQHIFVGEMRYVFAVIAHAMHSRSARSPRLIHDLVVPSGMRSLPAISPWE